MNFDNEQFENLTMEQELVEELVFTECKFIRCKFFELKVKNCSFRNCVFQGCTVLNNTFEYTDGLGNDFEDCALIGISWLDLKRDKTTLLPFSGFRECTLKLNSFYGFKMKKTDFSLCDLTSSIFEQCDLKESSFRRANLQESIFDNNDLSGVDFRDAENYAISLSNNKMVKSKFSFPDAINLLTASGIIVD